jgi:hypothetical protein
MRQSPSSSRQKVSEMDELPKLGKVRGRTEAPHKPDYFDTSLLLIGGKNPLGEPNLKVSWGWDLRMFRGGNPEALKYPGPFLDRWILEKWLPPEFFGSERHWEECRYQKRLGQQGRDLLGEYPRKGAYGMVMPLTTQTGEFIPLDNQVLEFIDWMQAEFKARTLNVYSDAKRYAKLQEQMAREEMEMETQAQEQSQEREEYVRSHEFELNQERKYSLPTLWTPDGEYSSYRDETGAKHTLWEDKDGNGNARIASTMPNEKGTP